MDARTDLLALLGMLETLKKQHRAGEVPTYGQVEQLFDHADEVRRALSADLPIPGWGAKDAGDVAAMRAALDEADRRAQVTQVEILRVQEENARLRALVAGEAERLSAIAHASDARLAMV